MYICVGISLGVHQKMLNDADISAFFHDVSSRSNTDHANDERPTRKMLFEEPVRSSFVSHWTTKMIC